MSEPLVSVVLPVYNGLPYLRRAVDSLLSQDYRSLEILALDDGSLDGGGEFLAEAAGRDPRIRLISRENRGLIPTLNEGLSLARGDLVARMDADDISYPDRIRLQVEAFRREPALAMCGTQFDIVFGRDRVLPKPTPTPRPEDLPIVSMFYTAFRHSTVMFNRRVIDPETLRYDPTYPSAEDMDLFRRIAARWPTRVLPQALVAYRVHDDSVTTTRSREMRRSHLRIVMEGLERLGAPADLPNLLRLQPDDPDVLLKEMIALVSLLDGAAAAAPPAQRPAFEDGAAQTFFVLLRMAQGEHGPKLAVQLLDRTGGWARMRRRERYSIRPMGRLPWLGDAAWRIWRDIDRLEWRLRSHALDRRQPLAQTT